MLRAILIVLVCDLKISIAQPIQPPLSANPSEFAAWCNATFGGVADGGRCFYIVNATGNWTQNWAACRANGSVLAHIQTWKEKELVQAYAISYEYSEPGAKMTAIRDENISSQNCSTTPTTYWYENETTPNLLLSITNTVIKYMGCTVGEYASAPRCIKLDWTGAKRCKANVMFPLCQFTSPCQVFSSTGKCMTEAPIEEFAATEPQNCADACPKRVWCRSFNYISGNPGNKCQLFSRSMDDCNYGKCPDSQAESANCHHYNYV